MKTPLLVMVWALVVFAILDLFDARFATFVQQKGAEHWIRFAMIVLCSWLFFLWKKRIEAALISRIAEKKFAKSLDGSIVRVVSRFASIAAVGIIALTIMQTFGVNTTPAVAFGGIGAAAIGFAGKDIIANFCSGIVLQLSRPFTQGDLVLLADKTIEGVVEEIGWFRTVIRDKSKHLVYLPNNWFATHFVVNVSKLTHRHFKRTIQLPLDQINKVPAAVAQIRNTLLATPEVDTSSPIHVFLNRFTEYGCEIEINLYSTLTDLSSFNRFQEKILLGIHNDLLSVDASLLTLRPLLSKMTF